MKIELKNVKISESLSEETTAFTADIFVDGKKAGYARNDGRGGCTEYHSFPETRELFNKAEKFALTLPKTVHEFNGKKHEFNSNLELVIDNIIESILEQKYKKKIEKACLKGILKGNKFGYSGITFKMPIKEIVRIHGEKGVAHLQTTYDRIKSELKEGETIVNTNLEELGIKL
jgi:hypothetical protein